MHTNFTYGERRTRPINHPFPLFGISGTVNTATTTKTSTRFDTRNVSRVLVMMAVTGVTSSPTLAVQLIGYSAQAGSDAFANLAYGGVTSEAVKRYVGMASAPGRECFWFDCFSPWTAVLIRMTNTAGDAVRVAGTASNRPWVVLQRTPIDEEP